MFDYDKLKELTDKYFELNLEKYREDVPKDIEKSIFNELVFNMLNQDELDNIYTFRERDFEFVDKYNIDLQKLKKEFNK